MSLWNPDAGQGVRLDINARGELEAVLAQGGRTETVASGKPMLAREWYSVALSIDAQEGVLTLHQVPHRVYARVDDRVRVQQRRTAPALDGQTLLAFAATPAPAGAHHRHGADERQDRPSPAERPRAGRGRDPRAGRSVVPGHAHGGVVGVWDFSRRMESESIEDISGNQLHGRTLNLPVRAMKGANWTGEEMNWRHAPGSTGRCTFTTTASTTPAGRPISR
ncbi:hypothetical protein WJ970_21735 [Achromobacter xylosoxidans]